MQTTNLSATRRGRLLIVDDEPYLVTALQRTLGLNHEVRATTSGREALEILHSMGEVDMILCDLMMPEMSGMDLYEELARSAPQDAAKIVFMTGGAFTTTTRCFLDRIPNARLEKPFNVEKLLGILAEKLRPAPL